MYKSQLEVVMTHDRLMRFLAGDLVCFAFLLNLLQKLPVKLSDIPIEVLDVWFLLNKLLLVLAASIHGGCLLRSRTWAFHTDI